MYRETTHQKCPLNPLVCSRLLRFSRRKSWSFIHLKQNGDELQASTLTANSVQLVQLSHHHHRIQGTDSLLGQNRVQAGFLVRLFPSVAWVNLLVVRETGGRCPETRKHAPVFMCCCIEILMRMRGPLQGPNGASRVRPGPSDPRSCCWATMTGSVLQNCATGCPHRFRRERHATMEQKFVQ